MDRLRSLVPEKRVRWGIHCMQKLHQATVDSMLKGHRIFVCPKYLCIWISLFALNISTLLFSCLLVIFFASTKSIDALNTELTCNWKCLRPAQYIELTSIYRIKIKLMFLNTLFLTLWRKLSIIFICFLKRMQTINATESLHPAIPEMFTCYAF